VATETETEASTTETAPTEEPAGETVEVAADPEGQLAFEPTELEAKAGKVTFAFTNKSPVPHDFVIEQDGDEVARGKIISESEENVEADLEAGEYAFFCSVPGHRQAGMEGTLAVK
jgi:plastocyanin